MPIVRISSDMVRHYTRPRAESAPPPLSILLALSTPLAAPMRKAMWSARIRGAVLTMLVLLLTACTIENPLASATPTPAGNDQITVPGGETTPTPGTPAPVGESRQLVLWLPTFFDPGVDSTAGSILNGAFFQFEQNNPGLGLDVQIKSDFGQTGMLNYLRAAQRVAPAILPDVVLIHSTQLWQIADLGLIAPLSNNEASLRNGHYPFALQATTYRDQAYGIPYTVNLLLAVTPATASGMSSGTSSGAATTTPAENAGSDSSSGTTTAVPDEADDGPTATPPLDEVGSGATPGATVDVPLDISGQVITWDTLLAGNYTYVFPAGALEGSRLDSAVMHYLAAGGALDDEGAATASADALETMFEFLILARQNSIVPESVTEYADYESLWNDFVQGEMGNLALMSGQHLLQQANSEQYRFGPVPTAGGDPTTIGNTWAFAILTQDEQRRALARDLIASLLAPTVQGPWSQAALRIPSHAGALESWSIQNDYTDLLTAQLARAEAIPAGRTFADFARRLHNAQSGLLLGELSGEEALLEIRAPE